MTRFQLIWYCLLSGQEQYCSRIVCSFVCLSSPCQNGFMRNEMVVDCVIGTIGETTFPGQTRPISTHHNEGVISAKASFFCKVDLLPFRKITLLEILTLSFCATYYKEGSLFWDFLRPIKYCFVEKVQQKEIDRDRTRTCNPQIRSLVPYPLGHTVFGCWKRWVELSHAALCRGALQ